MSWDPPVRGLAGPGTVYDVRTYDAPGTGALTATAGITAAFNAAKAAGGGIVFLPEGTYLIDTAGGLGWTTGKVALVGTGAGSVLKAGAAATAQVLKITVGSGGAGRFADFLVTADGIATHAIVQTAPAETSVQTTFERVAAQGAKSYQWVNLHCEDCLYLHCVTPGNESTPGAVPRSFTWTIPDGACTVVGGVMFGTHSVNAQLLSYTGTTFGPILVDNATPSTEFSLHLAGCYIYDDSVAGINCIDTNTNLCTITAIGCEFVAQDYTSFVNGNIPATASLRFLDCTWVQAAATGTTLTLVQASGAGALILDGGNVVVDGATKVVPFVRVTTASTALTVLSPVNGVTVTESPHVSALPVVATTPATGVALINGTQTILSVPVPNDGKQHLLNAIFDKQITTALTGGDVVLTWTCYPNTLLTLGNAATAVGRNYSSLHATSTLLVPAGSTVTLKQTTAMTAGAATVHARIVIT